MLRHSVECHCGKLRFNERGNRVACGFNEIALILRSVPTIVGAIGFKECFQALSVGSSFLPHVAITDFEKKHPVAIFAHKVAEVGIVLLKHIFFVVEHGGTHQRVYLLVDNLDGYTTGGSAHTLK